MPSNTCYIFGAGDITPCSIRPSNSDIVIAADGGYNYAKQYSISPDILIGDLDSADISVLPESCIRHPMEKDDTDMMLAIKYGLWKGYKDFQIYGGLGGRLDHTLANLQSLAYLAEHGTSGTLWGDGYNITAIKDTSLTMSGKEANMISVFSLSDISYGVTLEYLKYPLVNATVTNTFAIGTSNQFTTNPAKITVKKGTLAILWYL